jgi:aldose 1-epimerase
MRAAREGRGARPTTAARTTGRGTRVSRVARAVPSSAVDTVTLRDPVADVCATFAPGAGMVCCSLRHEGEELVAQNDGLEAYARTGATMGIPLLHPWANRLDGWSYAALGRTVDLRAARAIVPVEEHGLPIHGTLPRAWRVVASDWRLAAELAEGASAAFPYPHRVRLEVELSVATLRIRTTVMPTSPHAVPVAFGFHPYFVLPGVPRAAWRIELPVRCHVVTDERLIPDGPPERVEPYSGPLGDRVYDDGFDQLEQPAVFAVAGGGRRIEVAFEQGYGVAQVFAPADRDVVCFEPMTAPANALATGEFRLAPYTATFAVRVA